MSHLRHHSRCYLPKLPRVTPPLKQLLARSPQRRSLRTTSSLSSRMRKPQGRHSRHPVNPVLNTRTFSSPQWSHPHPPHHPVPPSHNRSPSGRLRHRHHSHRWVIQDIEGIMPKGPYLPCVSMAGRALSAGYPRYNIVFFHINTFQIRWNCFVKSWCRGS